MNKYNWQNTNWPTFEYDLSLLQEDIYCFGKNAGKASGEVSQLSNELQYEAYIDFMVTEAINTSEIEGEHLSREDVRSSIRNFLGLTNPPERIVDAKAEGISALMISVHKNFDQLLSHEFLFTWHKLVLHTDNDLLGRSFEVGKYRTEPMEIVSGPIGYEKVHFIAPPSERLEVEMNQFINWFNQTHPMHTENKIPGPVRAAIAHIWFESIHPFSDGNGRIGRALSELCLAQDMRQPVLLSLSTQIESNRKEYYHALAGASKNLDINDWLVWFITTINKAQEKSRKIIDFILIKAKFWDSNKHIKLNIRQQKVINKIFGFGYDGFEGGLTAKKYISMTKCSKATATRDLVDLRDKGILISFNSGKNTKYSINIAS